MSSRQHIHTTKNGDRYDVSFISSGMGETDFRITRLGAGFRDHSWRVRKSHDTGAIRCIDCDQELAEAAVKTYETIEHEAYLEFCKARGLDPNF
jgi:hypothetical protein